MTPWNNFYDFALPDLPGCPPGALNMALREAAIVFCEHSLGWKQTHSPVAVVAGTSEYLFAPPLESVVHAVIHAGFNGRAVEPYASQSDRQIEQWRKRTGTPEYIAGDATSLTLIPEPDSDGILTMAVVLKPSPTAAGIDDSMFNEYRAAIIHGALARLMLSPKKPYTNAQLAAYHRHQFTIETAAAGTRAARKFSRAPLKTAIQGRRK